MPTEIEQLAEQLLGKELLKKALDEIAQAIYTAIIGGDADAFVGRVSPEALRRARDLANTAAESLMRDLTETQLLAIGEKIAEALEEGVRPRDIGKLLDEVTELDSVRERRYENYRKMLENSDYSPAEIETMLESERERLLRERRETIANTEGHYATSAARRLEAETSGRNMKLWIAREDEVLCDVCYENMAVGAIGIDEIFPSGDSESPAHPNCRCAMTYFKDSPQEREYYANKTAERVAAADAARGEEV